MKNGDIFQLGHVIILLVIVLCTGCNTSEESAIDAKAFAKKPNIVFILADDQRNDALGCAGHPIIKTPIIDGLAEKGLRFVNAFVTTPICAASRATILTGLTERTHGYTFGKEKLSQGEMANSYPALLRKEGYSTAFFGKFGVQMSYNSDSLFDSYSFRDRPYLTDKGHIDEINTREALQFIESAKDGHPFCLSISYSSAHAEDGDHIPGEEHHFAVIDTMKGMYQDADISNPRLEDPAIFDGQPNFLKQSLNRVRYNWRWDTQEKYTENMKAYYGLISGIDFMVGQILKKLDAKGLADNTIIIYMADNGYYMGERGFAGKWSHYEESIRVPLILYDPRLPEKKRDQTSEEFVLNMDIAPTVLNMAGIDIPDEYQGQSLLPFLIGQTPDNWRESFFMEHLMSHDQIPKWEGVRTKEHTYARYFDEEPMFEFLHDLNSDPDELVNFSSEKIYEQTLEDLRNQTNVFRDNYEGIKK